jgi:transcriptional regulator with XRE-family HTH domain
VPARTGPLPTSLGSRGRAVDYLSGSRAGSPGCPTVGVVTTRGIRTATSRPGGRGAQAGELLRHWRQQRRRSQLDLALDTGVSARHLSFVETGRSRASSSLLLALAEQLDVPLRERNALLLAAGYAPAYSETDLDGAQARAVRESLGHLLSGHEPYPLLEGAHPQLLEPPVNVYRLGLHPGGLPSRIRDRTGWTAHLVHRLTRLERLTGDRRLADLLAEVRAYPGVAEALAARPAEPAAAELLLTVHLAHPRGGLLLHSTVTSFGDPRDVTLSELAVESFFPADERTRELLRTMAAA